MDHIPPNRKYTVQIEVEVVVETMHEDGSVKASLVKQHPKGDDVGFHGSDDEQAIERAVVSIYKNRVPVVVKCETMN